MNNKIDFVITWVDGNDEEWLKEKNKYSSCKEDIDSSKARYRDWNLIKYWFRSVEKNASWVNKIYFVTCGHIPSWLNTKNEKLVIVNHKDYIPKEYLPTFNSCTIELHLHKIKGLSEKFVYFNDDMLINKKVSKESFFKNNLPLDNLILTPVHACNEASACIHYNCMKIINKYFNHNQIDRKKLLSIKNGKYLYKNMTLSIYPFNVGFRFHHVATSYLKSTFEEVWDKEATYLKTVSSHKFRENNDVSQWMFQFWQLASNKFELRDINKYKYYDLGRDFENVIKEVNKPKHELICLNDNNEIDDFELKKEKLIETLQFKYPSKSSFEK